MITQAACAFTTLSLFGYYHWQNKKRGAIQETEEKYMAPEVWAGLTDRKNKKFRYTY